MVIDHRVDVRLRIVEAQGVALQREHVGVLGGDDGRADIHVGQEAQIVVINGSSKLADVAGAAEFHGGGNAGDGSGPNAAGDGIPGDLDFLSGSEAAYVGLVDEDADQDVGKIGEL